MKKILCFLPGLAMLIALAGCCANDSCNCQDELADALVFSFDIKTSNGFTASQIDTFFIVRISHPNATYPTVTRDSVLQVLPLTASGTGLKRDSIVINNAAPFALSGGNTKLSSYDFQINASQVTSSTGGIRTTNRYSFTINNIKLDGRYEANGCCTCYGNTGKQFDLSSRFLVSTTNFNTAIPQTTAVTTATTAAQNKNETNSDPKNILPVVVTLFAR